MRSILVLLCLYGVAGAQERVPCENNVAAGFPCAGVDLLARVRLGQLDGNGVFANDLWGWVDEASGREFVLLGTGDGVRFIEITDPFDPVYLGNLPTSSFPSPWRDIKVYRNHAFVVAEAPNHGMQVFALEALLANLAGPTQFQASVYTGQSLSNAHNLAINESSGFAYVVGTNTCNAGLHMVDIREPSNPRFAGCFGGDGYTHDAHCVNYRGPDRDYEGREICFAFNEDTLTVVDVSDKSAPRMVSRTSYAGNGYTHQGWTTDDQLFLVLGDELDEEIFGHNTRTRIFDVSNLDGPQLIGIYEENTAATDHNLYIQGNVLYQANYRAGLRLFTLEDIALGELRPAGYFDIFPSDDEFPTNGAWSVYPYFPSGVVAVSDIENGLVLLDPRVDGLVAP